MGIETNLKEFGLSSKEAKMYLSSLSLGTSSITQLAKKAGLKRPTAYLVIDDLLQKHLLVKIPKGKKTFYKAENPETFSQQLENKRNALAQMLPELKNVYLTNLKQPKIRFYEGKENIYKIQEEMCKAKEIWAVFSPEKFLKVFSHKDNEHFFRVLVRHGGIIYDMFEDTEKAREFSQAKYRFGISEVKFLPPQIKFATDIWVHEDKLTAISFENLTAVVIEDESIAKTQKQLLKFIWSHLK